MPTLRIDQDTKETLGVLAEVYETRPAKIVAFLAAYAESADADDPIKEALSDEFPVLEGNE